MNDRRIPLQEHGNTLKMSSLPVLGFTRRRHESWRVVGIDGCWPELKLLHTQVASTRPPSVLFTQPRALYELNPLSSLSESPIVLVIESLICLVSFFFSVFPTYKEHARILCFAPNTSRLSTSVLYDSSLNTRILGQPDPKVNSISEIEIVRRENNIPAGPSCPRQPFSTAWALRPPSG
jgi:hypothetical protein